MVPLQKLNRSSLVTLRESECTRVRSNVMKCQCISQCETYCIDMRKVKSGLYTVCDNIVISGLHVVKPEQGRGCCDVDTCKGMEKRNG